MDLICEGCGESFGNGFAGSYRDCKCFRESKKKQERKERCMREKERRESREYPKTGLTGWQALHLVSQDEGLEMDYQDTGKWMGYQEWCSRARPACPLVEIHTTSFCNPKWSVRKKETNLDDFMRELYGKDLDGGKHLRMMWQDLKHIASKYIKD